MDFISVTKVRRDVGRITIEWDEIFVHIWNESRWLCPLQGRRGKKLKFKD
jgi:hypothetical protein